MNLLKPFEESSYRGQVRILRELAQAALRDYSIKIKSLSLINHGENATFKVIATDGSKYLLRVHRNDYHSNSALHEELGWLKSLRRSGLQVPEVIPSRSGASLVSVSTPQAGTRHCDLFQWIDGRFLSKSISEKDMFKIGVLLAEIQDVGRKSRSRHRRYWTSEGLVGSKAKFGSIDQLNGVPVSDQKKLTSLRKKILTKLKAYERSQPRKMGLIHADLHFGNLLKVQGGAIAAIDFDDCGFGFYIYDLAIPLVALEHQLQDHNRFGLYPQLKRALIAGYASQVKVSDQDLSLLQDLIIARKLLMLGWLQSRLVNPKFHGRIKIRAKATLKYAAKPTL